MEQPLYKTISDSVVDGKLSKDFHLPTETPDGVPLENGALDGVLIYHRAPGHQLTDEQERLIEDAVKAISDGEFYDAEELIWRIAEEIGPLDAHDPLRRYIVEHIDDLSPENLGYFSVTMFTVSPDIKVVKIALSIMSLFEPVEEVKDTIRTLGLSDELTFYAATCMDAWENANDEMFELAQKVGGWGRIHLVSWLQPETDEIRRWLLREGVHNSVMWEYSALDCWEKADVPAVLAGEVSPEDFHGIVDIVWGLILEGPVMGISGVEDAETHIIAFLNTAKSMDLNDRDRKVIGLVRGRFSNNSEITELCNALL